MFVSAGELHYICAESILLVMRKKPYYLVIDLFNPKNSLICSSIIEISGITKVHRNTIKPEEEQLIKNYLILPRKLH